MAKDLALMIGLGKIPDDVKKIAQEYANAYLLKQKADAQVAKWLEEASKANSTMVSAGNRFNKALEAWDPADTRKAKPEEKADIAKAIADGKIK